VARAAWPGGAATRRGSFLTKIFAGGLFWHFTHAGGLICQKFRFRRLDRALEAGPRTAINYEEHF
jgi:hypothetical protein